jgi:hypothetical protein
MLLAVLLTLLATGSALAVASRRRIHRAILALVAAFVAVGAVIGSIPGAFVLIGFTVVAATGPSTGISWAFWTTLAAMGTLAGLALGAYGAGALSRPRVNRVALRAASSALFALFGVGLSAIVLAVTAKQDEALLVVLPALVIATSVLGFTLPRTR